jgi:hypothetical protein
MATGRVAVTLPCGMTAIPTICTTVTCTIRTTTMLTST